MLKLKILITDDSATIRELVRDAFEKRGYKVLGAPSGEEALEITLREHPDLIISDISMPGMNGWEFCGQVRTNPYTSFIPFVFLSKKVEAPDRIKGLQMGADDYITKPFDLDELVARVELIFNRMVKAQEAVYSKQKGFSGSTRDMAVPDLLQMFQSNRKTGVLKIAHKPGVEGRIAFDKGDIINASLGNFKPIKAIQRMLAWEEAKFELEPLAPESITQSEKNAIPHGGSVESMLLDSFRIQDELARLRREKSANEVSILTEALKNMAGLSIAQRKVLVRARRTGKVDELLDIDDLTDLEVYEVIVALVEGGYLKRIS